MANFFVLNYTILYLLYKYEGIWYKHGNIYIILIIYAGIFIIVKIIKTTIKCSTSIN